MDPLSIAASAFSLAGGIAKASFALIEFSRNARDASKDLRAVIDELHALSAVLDPIARCLTTTSATTIPEALAAQVDSALRGCVAVVEQITENVNKYRQDKIITKTEWVMFGQSDIQKLRESLEAYKMALGLGMHVITMSITQAVKEDTTVIRDFAAVIKLNTDEILARVNSIKRGDGPSSHRRIEDWMEDMAVLSTYAETTYQGTVADPTETSSHIDSPRRLSVDSNPSDDRLLPPLARLERTLDALALEDAQKSTEVAKRKEVTPQVPTRPPLSFEFYHRRPHTIERASAPGLSEQGQPQISDQARRWEWEQTPRGPGKEEEAPPQSPSTPLPIPNPSSPRHDPALFGQPSPNSASVSDPPVIFGELKGHKRAESMEEIAAKVFGRGGSLFGGRTRERDNMEQSEILKRYPPMSMRSPTPSNESRVSIDSRRSRRSFAIGLGRKRSRSMSGSETSQERQSSRRTYPAPELFSPKADDAHPLNSHDIFPIQAYEPYRQRRSSSFGSDIADAGNVGIRSRQQEGSSYEGRGIITNRWAQNPRGLLQKPKRFVDAYDDDPGSSGSQRQRGVLQMPKRFVDAYDDDPGSSGSGSSGPARRVLDFFRRRGKARDELAYDDFGPRA